MIQCLSVLTVRLLETLDFWIFNISSERLRRDRFKKLVYCKNRYTLVLKLDLMEGHRVKFSVKDVKPAIFYVEQNIYVKKKSENSSKKFPGRMGHGMSFKNSSGSAKHNI